MFYFVVLHTARLLVLRTCLERSLSYNAHSHAQEGNEDSLGVSQRIFISKKTGGVGIYAEAGVESTWYPQIGDTDFPTPVGTGAIGA